MPLRLPAVSVLCLILAASVMAQRRMEDLGRGVVAVRTSSTQVYIGWRLLGSERPDTGFNVYRRIGTGTPVLLNAGGPITASTNLVDSPGSTALAGELTYTVVPVVGGVEQAPGAPFVLPANATAGRQFFTLPLSTAYPNPASTAPYDVKFGWVGDFDGDGEYDFLVDRVSTVADQRQYLEAYRRDGTFLWRMDMGPNSLNQYSYEPGSSAISVGDTDNVTVYDLDGNGRAEVIVRTANGVTVTNAAGMQVASVTAATETAQFVSVFEGLTGSELARTPLPNPWAQHGTLTNKCAIAYLDGREPSVLFYGYNRADSGTFYRVFSTFDYRNGTLSLRWSLPQDHAVLRGSEGHQIRIADVDNDGRDEICDIGHVIDDNGTQLFTTELTHGDRFHIADINPDRPGLETFAIQQNNGSLLATALYDSGSGRMLKKWYSSSVVDVGRGIALDLTSAHKGYELYSTQPGIFNAKGEQIYANSVWAPEGLWWDADLLREFIDGAGSGALSPVINKFNASTGATDRLWTLYNDAGAYSTRQAYGGRPAFWGDILGDWREELVFVTSDYTALRIYTTTSVATNRLYTLMHNPAYRCQATTKGYVQASYVDYYLGHGMTPPPPPPMTSADLLWKGGPGTRAWDTATLSWREGAAPAAFQDGRSVLFDLSGDNAAAVQMAGTLQPASVTVYSPINYTFDGTSGSLVGSTTLTKSGRGELRITGSHSFTGNTTVWDGALRIDGTLSGSPITVWGGTWGGPDSAGRAGGRLAGSGTVSQAVVLAYRSGLTPGDGMDGAGTLALGSTLTAQDGATLAFDLPTVTSGPSGNSDRLAIAGSLSLSGTVTVVLSSPDGTIAPGTYTLATYGSLSGSLSNLRFVTPAGAPCSFSLGPTSLTVTVASTRAPSTLVWTGGAPGNAWDLALTPNWSRSGSPDVFVSGDTVSFDDTSASYPNAVIASGSPVAGVSVSGSTSRTFSGPGSIAGAGGLTKTGTGTLTLSTVNTYTGPTVISGGTVIVQTLADGGMPSSIGASSNAASNLVLDGGILRLASGQVGIDRSATLGAGGGTLDVPGSSSTLVIRGTLTGPGSLTKAGTGTLVLNAAHNHSGGTILQAGRVLLGSDTANVSGLGTRLVTLQGGTLAMADNDDIASAATSAWNLFVPQGSTGRLDLDSRCNLTGSLTGSGDFQLYTPFVRSELKGNWSAFTGRIFAITDADGGELRLWSSAGMPSAELNLAASVRAAYLNTMSSNVVVPIGALSGVAGSTLSGGPTGGRTLTWQIGDRDTDTLFAGVISNAASVTALTKVGTGSLTLTGASTYTGATRVSAGVLVMAGGSLTSPVTVSNGAGFGGAGSVTGNLSLESGSLLLANPSAPLAVTGNLSLGGTITIAPAPGASLAAGTYPILTYTGTLTGTPQFAWSGSGFNATFDATTAGQIHMTLTAPPRPASEVVWTGAETAAWDTSASNWTLAGQSAQFQTADTARFDDTSSVNTVTLASVLEPAAVIVDASRNYTFSGAGSLAGVATLEKSGSGTLTLSGANSHGGGTTLTAGTLALGVSGSLGTGTVTLRGGTLATGALAPPNSLVIDGTARITGGHGGGNHAIRNVSGSGSVTLEATNVFDMEGSFAGFSGTVLLGGTGSFRFFGGAASAAAAWDLETRTLSARSGSAFALGSLAGSPGSVLTGASGTGNTTAVTYTVGALGASTTFSGAITNGNAATSLVKTGSGSLTLAGTSSHSGTTTVSQGALVVTGSLGNTAVSVSPGAAFGGNGTLAGGLTMASGSTLLLGIGPASRRGPAVSGGATLNGSIAVSPLGLGGTLTPGTYVALSFTGGIGGAPALAWTNAPGGAFTATFDTSQAGQLRVVLETPRDMWMRTHFGTTVASGDAAPDADPDGDGLPNLVEYAIGSPPDAAGAGPAASLSSGALALAFSRRADPYLSYTVDAADSPAGPWTAIWTSTGTANIAGAVQVVDPTQPSPAMPRFLRLAVSYAFP